MNSEAGQSKEDFFFKEIFPLIKENHEKLGWPDVQPEDVKPTYLKALSNMTYQVRCKIPGVPTLLAKRFGQGFLDRLLDRSIDNKVSKAIGDIGVGPKVLHFTEKCRLEEFLVCEEFTAADMHDPRMRLLVAYELQKLHRTVIPELPKESLFDRCISNNIHIFQLYREALEEKKDKFSDKEKERLNLVNKLIDEQEIDWLSSHLKAYSDDLVVSHNDPLNGNILKLPSGELKLIDFEYCTYNFRACDIAGFLLESLIDYTVDHDPYFRSQFADRESIINPSNIVKYYLLFSAYPESPSYEDAKELIDNPQVADKELVRLFGSEKAWQNKVDMFSSELESGYLLSHYWWSLWAIIMSKNPLINFNYVEFAYQRTLDYFRIKEKVIANSSQGK